jgi:hypothetical protein
LNAEKIRAERKRKQEGQQADDIGKAAKRAKV